MKTIALCALLFTVGCATIDATGQRVYKVWYKEGATPEQARQDWAGCQLIAAVNAPQPFLPSPEISWGIARQRQEMISLGMQSQGYTIRKLPRPEAENWPRP